MFKEIIVYGILAAMSLHTTILEQGNNVLDNGFKEIENEFDEFEFVRLSVPEGIDKAMFDFCCVQQLDIIGLRLLHT